jgi:hypothetical protein
VPPSACLVFGARSGTKPSRPCVCLLLAYPTSLSSLYLHTCTLIRGVLPHVLNLFIGMIEVPPGRFYHLIPIAQTSLLDSTFPSPPSPPPQGRQVGFLK